jgi:hypothetical protein
MPVTVELEETSNHIIINADWRFKELCKSIPGSGYDAKTQMWKVPVSWSACLALRSTFKTDLEIGQKLTDWAANERSTRVDPANELRNLELLPDGEGDQDLFPHQRAGVKFLKLGENEIEFVPEQFNRPGQVVMNFNQQFPAPGVYEIKGQNISGENIAFNYPTKESDLSTLRGTELESALETLAPSELPVQVLESSLDNLSKDLEIRETGVPLWKWFLLFVLLFLMLLLSSATIH